MDKGSQIFIETLRSESDFFATAFQKVTDYWKPDEVPLTTLFGDMGREFFENYNNLPESLKKKILFLVEDAVLTGSDDLQTAVTTGLIETMVSLSERRPDTWHDIYSNLGSASRRHADAWMNS
jgi:hypothetical protein